MFCKWCGKRIANVGSPCPSCGRNQDRLENGNGFWDLCSNEAGTRLTDAGVSAGVPAKVLRTEKPSKKGKTSNSSAEGKTARRFWIATCTLLVSAIIMVGISVGTIGYCLHEISVLHSSLCSLNTLASDGFAQLEDYHHSVQAVLEAQNPEAGEKGTDESIDVDALFEEGSILFDDEKLNLESFKIETTPAKCAYMAVGEVLEAQNVKIVWQKSVDQGETWVTVSEDIPYVIAEISDTEAYRVICVITDENEECSLYCAATVVLNKSTDDITETENTDAAQPTENLEKEDNSDLTDGSNDNDTMPTEPGDESVG